MKNLINLVEEEVKKWRVDNYKSNFNEIKTILNFQKTEIENEYTYLRKAQFEAIETYLFLRFVKRTPKIIDLYKDYYKTPQEFCDALNITQISAKTIEDVLLDVNKEENKKKHKYHSLIETLSLDYSSYILALTMGSGKTNVISSIIAIEFAISMENEEKIDFDFMQNALVFAPGLTILKNSLKKISLLPFEKILPPEMCRKFLVNVKYIQTTNNKELNIVSNSKWNIIVINSEKMILRSNSKNNFFDRKEEEKNLASNSRLEKIKSLANLGIFSDEAHHTYGNKIGDNLKKVRETINHIHENKDLICVVNTTGTPYIDRKMLKDVVFWYGLEDGIRDGILKNLNNGIREYSTESMKNSREMIFHIIDDFFSKYDKNEKIAFYFKSEKHLEDLKKYIEEAIFEKGLKNDIIFKYTLDTKNNENEKEFLSLDDIDNKKRVLLLIGMGKEGWDCKTLFATALISEASSSNNYILQASTRCLRQLEGNTKNATIYLSSENVKILNKELEANYQTNLQEIGDIKTIEYEKKDLIVKKTNPPKLEVKFKELKIVEDKAKPFTLKFTKPTIESEKVIVHTANLENNKIVENGEYEKISSNQNISILMASNIIATKYHLKNLDVLKELQRVYQSEEMPEYHIEYLCKQIDASKQNYKEIEEITTKILAIIKTSEGFKKSEDGSYYYHTIKYREGNEPPIFKINDKKSKYGFHYEPYNFDSEPEKDFFEKILALEKLDEKDIEDIYFTGGITTPDKTDFHFQYKGKDGKYHQYYPDFLIKKKNGKMLIVEIKAEKDKDDTNVKAKIKAIQEIENINEGQIKYVVLYTNGDTINKADNNYLDNVLGFIKYE